MDVIIRIFKSWQARDPERRWVNNYEAHSDEVVAPDAFESMMNDIVAAEKLIHLLPVQFLSATISTWEADSVPYNPSSFFTYELAGGGGRGGAADVVQALDSNVCYLVKRQTHGGKSGKLFYRGCLEEADVQMGGDGRFVFTAGTGLATPASPEFAAYATAMAPHLSVGAGGEKMALISMIGVNQVARLVESLAVGGITINRRNHRYFDRV